MVARPLVRGWRRRLLLAYLLALSASTLIRWSTATPASRTPSGGPSIAVDERRADGSATGRRIRLAYRTWGAEGGQRPPLLALHGSPGSHHDFDRMAPQLAGDRQVIAPDLPGFGSSIPDVADYSIRAHAHYALALLDHLETERAHLLGFSMGSGVALEVASLEESRTASLTLLCGIGVQEMELLGDYHLNHLIHGLQLAGLWALRELTPHFGALDGAFLGVPYARNFYDTDQRPLRDALRRLEAPTLIVHGRRDPLVPIEAAVEHHRLVPQSELLLLDSDHFFIFRGDIDPSPQINAFLSRVDATAALRRQDASPERLAAAGRPFDPADSPPFVGVTLLVVLGLLALATLASEDLTCVGAGLLVAQGRLGLAAASIACFAGIYFGDLLLFWLGRVGRPLLRRAPLRWWLDEARIEESSAWLRRRGAVVIWLSRFLPGTRLPTYVAAGALRTPFLPFAGYFLLAAGVWTPALVGLSAWAGEEVQGWLHEAEHRLPWLLLGVLGSLVVLRRLVLPLFTWPGRRRLLGTWRRWTQWEFWPPWLFYSPIVLYLFWLGFRHRGLLTFTAANPAIPAGGFVGESKAEILALIPPEHGVVPPWQLLPSGSVGDRLDAIEAFRARHRLAWPLVLKPDVGQRGSGVVIAADREAAATALAASNLPTLVQAFVPGREYGVFWVRPPGASRGRILSITDKLLPEVVGDGQRTIEELILADPRAVAQAGLYLRRFGERRHDVPIAGERVALAVLGTHCRGAVFRDGRSHRTPALEAAIDRLSQSIEGFDFGRYDLRVADVAALEAGGPFQLLELNGVTSEATHIYDPEISLGEAYRTLAEQWRLAYEIGAQRRAAGASPAGLRQLAARWLEYRRAQRSHPEA